MLIKTYRLRLYVLYLIPLAIMAGLIMRLYFLQVMHHDYWKSLADAQHYSKIGMIPMRGKIFDANGHELAGSVILDAGYIELQRLPQGREKLIQNLASEFSSKLNLKYDKVFDQLSGKYNLSPLLARDLTDKDKVEIRKILHEHADEGVPPNLVEFKQENKRQYSRGSLAPHVIGFTQRDVVGETGDNKGASGVERSYDSELKGKKETYITRTSATGNPMEPADPEVVEATYGHNVKLTINESLQAVTQNVLAQGVDNAHADSGVAVCYHVKTGEILALANYPTFDLTNVDATTVSMTKNRAITDPIEPGSVMKIITFTSLFDDKKMEPSTLINCEGGDWTIPGIKRHVQDSHDLGLVPVSEVFQYSSNIGTIKAAQNFERKAFYDHIRRFGFGQPTGIDLPGESWGKLRNYKDWDAWSMSSLPMGYEMQVTAVQVVKAVGAIANKGAMLRPHVVKEILDHSGNTIKKIEPEFVRQVADPVACRKIVNLMELVVEKGTAKAAKLEGYRVGGKTGTTKKVGKNGYEDAYIAGFCGIAPIEDPEVCIYVYIDNPRGESVYGGPVSGPVFREIAREAMRVLRIPEHRNTMPPDDFKVALEKVRKQIDGRAPMEIVSGVNDGDDSVSTGTVPDFRRLSMAEAVRKAAKAGLEVRVSGNGIVFDQDPAPYETIEDNTVITLSLTNTRQFIRQQVEDYEERMDLENEKEIASADTGVDPMLTSVSLSLTTGDNQVDVPVNAQPAALWTAARSQQKPEPEATPAAYPDLDEYARKPVDPNTVRKSWDAFEKEVARLEKEQRENPVKAVAADPAKQAEPTDMPTDRPIPVFDGSEELDPSGPEVEPIKIVTPKLTPAPSRDSGVSLYNL